MPNSQRSHSPAGPADYGAGLRPGERSPAGYAASAVPSRGRRYAEPECPTRSPFQRDRDRIIHAAAFRRLTHKTQMFIFHEGDHYRTRLTHSLEVAQIARTISRQLRLDEDLAETLALAHDLGHPPFGHAGERALDQVMAPHGGFDHNVQSFRLVTALERKYAAFDGLNLTWESLEGLVKHNGPPVPERTPGDRKLVHALTRFERAMGLELDRHASAEAQCAAIADDIAWHTHDIDDGLRAGLIALADLAEVPILAAGLAEVGQSAPASDPSRRIYAVTRAVITHLIADVVAESRRRLAATEARTPDDIRGAGRPVVAFSDTMRAELDVLRRFLFARLYRHPRVNRIMDDAEAVVRDLLTRYCAEPGQMAQGWSQLAPGLDERRLARLAADFVAGMTDRYALGEHRRLFAATPQLR